jgi:hypothetical protein
MNEDELTKRLLIDFTDATQSEAKQVSRKAAKYIDEKEESEFIKEMRDPEYIPSALQNTTSPTLPLKSRWNQWIGQFSSDKSYQID